MSDATPADPAAPASAAPASAATAPAGPGPAPSRYAMGTVGNMVRSLLVIGALAAGLVLMVPRVSSIGGPPVDIHATALSVARQTGLPLAEAVGLPDGWIATSARWTKVQTGQMTWHAGYQAPSGRYVAVEQAKDATERWVYIQGNRSVAVGEVTVGGTVWQKWQHKDKDQRSLSHLDPTAGALSTIVTGNGTFEELQDLLTHLRPVTP